MRVVVFIAMIGFVGLTSCLKKIEEVDQMTSNIYDDDYNGDPWFNIVNYYAYQNALGQDKVWIQVDVPSSATPVLKPSLFYVFYSINESDTSLVYAPLEEDKSYDFGFSVNPDPSDSYCLTMGVFIEEDSTAINYFTNCVSL